MELAFVETGTPASGIGAGAADSSVVPIVCVDDDPACPPSDAVPIERGISALSIVQQGIERLEQFGHRNRDAASLPRQSLERASKRRVGGVTSFRTHSPR